MQDLKEMKKDKQMEQHRVMVKFVDGSEEGQEKCIATCTNRYDAEVVLGGLQSLNSGCEARIERTEEVSPIQVITDLISHLELRASEVEEPNERYYLSSFSYGSSRYHILSESYGDVQIEQTSIDEKYSQRVKFCKDELSSLLYILLVWYKRGIKQNEAYGLDGLAGLDDHPF